MNCLRVLLEAGTDPDICTKVKTRLFILSVNCQMPTDVQDGDCAIHEAVSQGSTESVRMLLKHGADRTKTGKVMIYLETGLPYCL